MGVYFQILSKLPKTFAFLNWTAIECFYVNNKTLDNFIVISLY